jgi:hypothetical protein
MKVKLEHIIDAMPALQVLAEKTKDGWPGTAKGAYRAGKLMRKMTNEHRDFLRAKDAAVKKHGKPVPERPDQVALDGEASKKVQAELDELLATEVTLDGCGAIEWVEIEGMKPALAPAVLADLQPLFLTEPAEEALEPAAEKKAA